MLNKVILMGRLTRAPELRHTQSNIPVVSFTLAVDRGYKKDTSSTASGSPSHQGEGYASVDFINIVAWRGTAEFISKWFSKGQLVAVSGMLQTRTYEDRAGNKRTATEVVADEVYFAESKRNGAGEGSSDELPPPASADFEEEEFLK